jgi:colanic acid/amylovoran biosynthesis glycosyltransferase
MKIAIYTGIINSGVRTNIEEMLRRGHDVDVIFEAPSWERYRPEFADDGLGRLRWFPAPSLPDTRLKRRLQAATLVAKGFVKYPRPFLRVLLDRETRKHHSMATHYCFGRVFSAIPSGGLEYDVVHAHSAVAARRAALLIEEGVFSGKLIVSFKGIDAIPILHHGDFARYEHLFGALDGATIQTEFMRRVVLELGVPAEKVTRIPSSVDASKIPPKPEAEIAPSEAGPLKMITVARFVEFKGHTYGIQAVEKLRERGVDVTLTHVGSGPLEEEIRREVTERGLEDHVHFAGRMPLLEVYEVMRRHDILLMPGIIAENGACEAMGLVSLEAQLVGLPVVASRVGGLPETLAPEGSGILTEPRDVESIVGGVQEMIARKDEWPQMVAHGRAHVRANYAIENTGALYQKLYDEVVTGKPVSQRESEHA